MPVLTVRTDEELLRRLGKLAERRGLTRSALVKQLLREALEVHERERAESHERLRLQEAIRALREGRKPPIAVDWNRLERELKGTDPAFPTVEAALAASRGRPYEA